ncbi:hypothetical protein [Tunturiibacter gelidiferens]|uniref:Uncharacterized protein n=1 Tax=Tunturiibacter gelidiferens TaxID=3069689 RepID=A0AAU7Z6B5_9BACT
MTVVSSPEAFTIQNKGLSAIGPTGSGLGYGGGTAGIGNSLAIRFDIHNNSGEGTNLTGFYPDGASPTIPAIDLTPSNIVLISGDVIHSHVSYDGANLTLLTDATTSASFIATYAVNIASVVSSTTAYVGFTA